MAAVVDSCCVCCRGGYVDSRHAKLWNVAVSSARFLYFIFLKVFRVGIDHAHCSSELASVSISSLDHLCKARLTPWQTALIVLYYCIRWLVYYILHIIYLYYILYCLYCIFYIRCFMSIFRKASLGFQFSFWERQGQALRADRGVEQWRGMWDASMLRASSLLDYTMLYCCYTALF